MRWRTSWSARIEAVIASVPALAQRALVERVLVEHPCVPPAAPFSAASGAPLTGDRASRGASEVPGACREPGTPEATAARCPARTPVGRGPERGRSSSPSWTPANFCRPAATVLRVRSRTISNCASLWSA